MKVAFATSLLFALPGVFGANKAATTLRRLDGQADDAAEEDAYEFLQHYEQVYLSCDANMKVQDADGNYEYGAVVYRLCPNGSACSDKNKVCSEGSGDYVVGLQTYMERFMQQFQRAQEENANNNYDNNQNNGEDFNMEEFGQCGRLNVDADEDEDGGNDDGNQVAYYVGPLCENGDIRLALFASYEDDENACIPDNLSKDVSFYDLTGFDLPWSSSIMDDDKCRAYYCFGYNENNEEEYNEFCTELFDNSVKKCEANMEYYSPYGQSVSDCEEISAMLPKSSGGGGAGWFVFALLVAAVAGFGIWYFLQQKKKGAINQEGLMM